MTQQWICQRENESGFVVVVVFVLFFFLIVQTVLPRAGVR